MSKNVTENLLKVSISRADISKAGLSAQKYDDILKGYGHIRRILWQLNILFTNYLNKILYYILKTVYNKYIR